MDMSAALSTQRIAKQNIIKSHQHLHHPKFQVYYTVPKSDHLLMLENGRGTTAGLIHAGVVVTLQLDQ